MEQFEKTALLQTPGKLTMMHNSFQYIQNWVKHYIIIHHALGVSKALGM